MRYYVYKLVRFFVLTATFVVLEFAIPTSIQQANASVLIIRRDPLSARIATTPLPSRDICSLKSCGPIYSVTKTVTISVTAYSSTPDQTSGDPFITASGTRVHHGTFALNGVPLGTQLRIPDYYGETIFTVEDRMHSRYSSYRGDIWMESRSEAIQWGVRHVRVEILSEG